MKCQQTDGCSTGCFLHPWHSLEDGGRREGGSGRRRFKRQKRLKPQPTVWLDVRTLWRRVKDLSWLASSSQQQGDFQRWVDRDLIDFQDNILNWPLEMVFKRSILFVLAAEARLREQMNRNFSLCDHQKRFQKMFQTRRKKKITCFKMFACVKVWFNSTGCFFDFSLPPQDESTLSSAGWTLDQQLQQTHCHKSATLI